MGVMKCSEAREFGRRYCDLLKRIVNGEAELFVIGRTWDETYAGEVKFECEGWKIDIFNDCDSFDYTDSVVDPSGITATFDDLDDHEADPLRYAPLFDEIDHEKLELALKNAKKR